MTIHLPEDLEQSLQMEVNRGRFASLDEALVEGASLLLRQLDPPSSEGTDSGPDQPLDASETFLRLATQWKSRRGPGSTAGAMSQDPSYRAILAMGDAAVPLILAELESEPDHWFAALRVITGANPIRPEDQGDLEKMARSWVEWGRRNGYEW